MSSGNENGGFESRYEKNSKLADRLARLILVGLAVEIGAVFVLSKPPLEGALTIVANVLIAAGVWGELIFSHRAKEASDGIVALAKLSAAEAHKRAADLEKQASVAKLQLQLLQTRVGPRRVNDEELKKSLADVPEVPVEILFPEDDGEAWGLAWQITSVLVSIEWPVVGPFPLKPSENPKLAFFPPQMAAGGQHTGVTLVTCGGSGGRADPRYATAADALWEALKRAISGDVVSVELNAGAPMLPPPQILRVVVASKP
jgi:hypothetical protein